MQKVASFFLSLSLIKGLSVLLQLAMILTVNLSMSQSSSGVFLWLYSLFFVLSAFSRAGQDLLILRVDGNSDKTSFSIVIINSLLFSLLSFLIAYAYTADWVLSLYVGLALTLNSVIVHRAHFLQSIGQYYLQVISNNFLTNLFFSFSVLFILYTDIVADAILLYVCCQLISIAVVSVFNKSTYVLNELSYDVKLIVEARYFCALNVTSFLINWFPPILIGVLLGDGIVSIVVILLRFGMVASFPLVVVNSFFAGKLRAIKGGIAESFGFFKVVNTLTFIISFIAVMVMTLGVDALFNILSIDTMYKNMFYLIITASFISSLTGPVALYLNMLGEDKTVFIFSCISFIAMVLVISILSGELPNLSVGIAILLQSTLSNIPLYIILIRKYKLEKATLS